MWLNVRLTVSQSIVPLSLVDVDVVLVVEVRVVVVVVQC